MRTPLLLLLVMADACMPPGWAPEASELPRGNWTFVKGASEISCDGFDPYWSDDEGSSRDFGTGDTGLVLDEHGNSGDCEQEVFTFTDRRHAFIAPETPCGARVVILEARLELLRGGGVMYLRRYMDIQAGGDDDPSEDMHCRVFESGYLVPPEAPALETLEPEDVDASHDVIEETAELQQEDLALQLDAEYLPVDVDNSAGPVL